MAQIIHPISILPSDGVGVILAGKVLLNPFLESIMKNDLDSVFFDTAGGFAEVARYTHTTGEAVPYKVIFDYPYASSPVGSTAEVITLKKSFRVMDYSLKRKPAKGDTVVFRNETYVVDSYEPDGVGTTRIFLDRM